MNSIQICECLIDLGINVRYVDGAARAKGILFINEDLAIVPGIDDFGLYRKSPGDSPPCGPQLANFQDIFDLQEWAINYFDL